ncbi:hypothetical protein MKW92_004333 [Papaver armeniacum]|nr:hypothetical protein MKW92_004333 [Papaver armeniacum]
MAKHESPVSTLLTPPTPVPKTTKTTEIDLEEGSETNKCRICLETNRRGLIAPCLCKGTSKYVHRDCLDQWRSVKEGFAFAHCTTCKALYHMKVNTVETKKWRTMKFRFLVTRDVVCIFIAVQLVMALFGYLVYLGDKSHKFGLRHALHFNHAVVVFYYICGALLFFALAGLTGLILTCFSQRVRDDLDEPCQKMCCCCSGNSRSSNHADNRSSGGTSICFFSDYGDGSSCCCDDSTSSDDDGSGLLIMVVVTIVIFAVIGLIYSILVATIVWTRIWQRHYHILAKRMLTKEYIVEDVDGLTCTESNWCPPPLPAEHVEQLKALSLL